MPWGPEPRVPLEVPGPILGTETQNANELISTISRITDSGLSEGTYAGGSIATTPSAGGSVHVIRPQRPITCDHVTNLSTNATAGLTDIRDRRWWQSWSKKYVLLCGTCGISSLLLGLFYLAIYLVLCNYTTSLQFFQTVPIYIPSIAMLLTGFAVICFIRRKNRHAYAIKLVAFMCLVCAVLCVIVTVTTTVIHMNRLQTLRECTFYTQLHSCTCLPFTDDEPFELKLDKDISNCDVIHGPLYSCLRAMFGVSVIGILVSIFSCMLVYQLLSHEKKKMYWEQLENRRLFMRRSQSANCGCCDEYGFATPSEVYPWAVWDSMEDRYWNGGAQVYSPVGEDISNASRSVLVGGGGSTPVTPSLWLPWGGAWGAHTTHAQIQNAGRESLCLTESTNAGSQSEVQNDGSRPRSTGVLLRPLIPRSLESRFGLRRQAPPRQHGQRPLSDPGVAIQLPRYPPPFTEAYLPPMGLESLPRYMWDPPPPYSQPTSSENIASSESSARRGSISSPHINQRTLSSIASPSRRPAILADLILDNSNQLNRMLSPNHGSGIRRLATHLHNIETPKNNLTTSLPINQRVRRLPISHVKSLDDITEGKKVDSMDILMCDGNIHLNRFHSQVDVPKKLLKNKNCRSGGDLRVLYATGKSEESELYFADVSSCVSGHNEDIMYYSEPIASGVLRSPILHPSNRETHLYEAVSGPEDDVTSLHNSDDTMIVHTSSNNSNCTDNAYSIVSPLTDQSSASPMVTDTDTYSCYNSVVMPSSSKVEPTANDSTFQQNIVSNSQIGKTTLVANDNEKHIENYEQLYEVVGNQESPTTDRLQPERVSSDHNGNLPQEEQFIAPSNPSPRNVQIRYGLSLPLRQELSFATSKESSQRLPEAKLSSPHKRKEEIKSKKLRHDRTQYSNSEPNTPTRGNSTPQEILFTLKSVNV